MKKRRVYHCAPEPCAECERLRAELKSYEDAAFERADAWRSKPRGGHLGAGGELERDSSGASSGAARGLVGAESPMPPHPPDDGVARPKWNSKWDFDRAEERVRIVVLANGPGGQEETIDAREFIERLGQDHPGTTFAIHVETEQI